MNVGLILVIVICCGLLPVIISINEKKKNSSCRLELWEFETY